jgi:hypothetical protein
LFDFFKTLFGSPQITYRPREESQVKPQPQPPKSTTQSKPVPPAYPDRWSIPITEIRQNLKQVLIDDLDDDGNPIKRKFVNEESNDMVSHWKDMVKSKDRFKDMFHPHIMQSRPYLQYDAVRDSRCCDTCKALDGKVIRSDDPRAAAFFPPLHIGCRCGMVTLSERELIRDGLTENWPDIKLPDIYTITPLFLKSRRARKRLLTQSKQF